MEDELTQIIAKRSIQINDSLSIAQNMAIILDERQTIISNLSEQITKYRCEQMKNEKLIKSLQDKINQLAPNIGNTGSNFMMSSQFKSNFEEFMTSVLPTSLSCAIDRPNLFSKCVEDLFMTNYSDVQQELNAIIGQISEILKINHLKPERKDVQLKIKLSLLKFLQEYWEIILPFKEKINYQYIDKQEKLSEEFLKQINQGISNEDFIQFYKNLHKLCVYMVLQDKPWQFSCINTRQIVKYSKKDYTCIDGWVKEGEDALLVLAGIVKDGHSHPNLKNYVIPLTQDEDSDRYNALLYRVKEDIIVQNQQKHSRSMEEYKNTAIQNSKQINNFENQVQIVPLKPILNQQSNFIMKNKSIEIMSNKENYPYAMNKKSKKKDNLKFSMETSLNRAQKSPKSLFRKHDQSIKNKKIEVEQVDQRIYLVREQIKQKKKSLMIHKNVNQANIGELLPLKQKNIEDLPMSKEINQKKKVKASTSRKNSVGKIFNQNHMIHHDKQNTQNINTSRMKNKDKEKIYKDIIKEKLLDDRIQEKTQHSLNILYTKPRSDRQKKKQQNRPLKIQQNANKLREKYIF